MQLEFRIPEDAVITRGDACKRNTNSLLADALYLL